MSRIKFRRKENKYTQIYNSIIFKEKDIELTGLYTIIQACIDLEINTRGTDNEFILSKKSLQHYCGCGERKFDKNWDSLKKAGYLKQYKIKASNGKFEYEYELLDEPDLTIHHSLIQHEDGSLTPNIPKNKIEKMINNSKDLPGVQNVPVESEGHFVGGAKCRGYYNNLLNKVSGYVSVASEHFALTNRNKELINSIEDKIDLDLFEEIVVDAKNKDKTFRYVSATVNKLIEKGIKTLKEFENDLGSYKEKKSVKGQPKPKKSTSGITKPTKEVKSTSPKTRYHNINQTFKKYKDDELEKILQESQKGKFTDQAPEDKTKTIEDYIELAIKELQSETSLKVENNSMWRKFIEDKARELMVIDSF